MLKIHLLRLIRELQFNSPLRMYFFPRHHYNFTVPQLCFLCQCLKETEAVNGSIAEIGCASGATTVFLNKFMDAEKIEKKYYALDTFKGFCQDDISYEVENRGKKESMYTGGFRLNSKKWFDGTMEFNRISRVISIEADVNNFDLETIGPISFALLDVDLYRPIKRSLSELYKLIQPNGIIVVDDCDAKDNRWNGAHQAYTEFMKELELPEEIIYDKLGIIRKTV